MTDAIWARSAYFSHGTFGTPLTATKPQSTFCYSNTYTETPAPIDLGPTGVFDSPTGGFTALERVDELVLKASKHLAEHSMLAVDPDASDRIDALMSERLRKAPLRRLVRKL